jgi:hypothetical protein
MNVCTVETPQRRTTFDMLKIFLTLSHLQCDQIKIIILIFITIPLRYGSHVQCDTITLRRDTHWSKTFFHVENVIQTTI